MLLDDELVDDLDDGGHVSAMSIHEHDASGPVGQ
jgi:hypothetical protein